MVLDQQEDHRGLKMDLKVPFSQASDSTDAYKRACQQITPEYIEKFKVKADISYDESAKKIEANGKGFTLTLNFTNSETQVSIKLSLMLRAFKGTVLETVERKLKKHV